MSREKERNKFDEIRNKSEDDFEKNITFISAGALGLSITFLEKIIQLNSSHYCWLILGWVFLILTLTINLSSHLLSSYYSRVSQEEFDEKNINNSQNINRRNKHISFANVFSVFFLILVIFLIVIFTSLNLKDMSNKNEKKSDLEIKGRTMPTPAKPKEINEGRLIPNPPPKTDKDKK